MSAGKDRLLAFVRDSKLEDQVVQLHVSWGTYYIASLFGSRRHVVLHAPAALTDARRLERARGIADSLDRGLLVISSSRHSQSTPELRSALGPPIATWSFDDWLAIRYLR